MPKSYQKEIIQRFYDKKALKEFDELYKEARFKHVIREPHDWEKKMIAEFKKGISISKLCRDYKITRGKFNSALAAVVREQ